MYILYNQRVLSDLRSDEIIISFFSENLSTLYILFSIAENNRGFIGGNIIYRTLTQVRDFPEPSGGELTWFGLGSYYFNGLKSGQLAAEILSASQCTGI